MNGTLALRLRLNESDDILSLHSHMACEFADERCFPTRQKGVPDRASL